MSALEQLLDLLYMGNNITLTADLIEASGSHMNFVKQTISVHVQVGIFIVFLEIKFV